MNSLSKGESIYTKLIKLFTNQVIERKNMIILNLRGELILKVLEEVINIRLAWALSRFLQVQRTCPPVDLMSASIFFGFVHWAFSRENPVPSFGVHSRGSCLLLSIWEAPVILFIAWVSPDLEILPSLVSVRSKGLFFFCSRSGRAPILDSPCRPVPARDFFVGLCLFARLLFRVRVGAKGARFFPLFGRWAARCLGDFVFWQQWQLRVLLRQPVFTSWFFVRFAVVILLGNLCLVSFVLVSPMPVTFSSRAHECATVFLLDSLSVA
jgi:hypothetical protein